MFYQSKIQFNRKVEDGKDSLKIRFSDSDNGNILSKKDHNLGRKSLNLIVVSFS